MASTELATGYISLAISTQGLGRQISREFTGVERQAEQSGKRSGSKFSSGMGGALRGVGALAGGAVVALAGLAAAGATAGIRTAAGMEQAKISFETMLGSATKADKFLRDLQKFAASTPFEFPELQTAASSLISAGIEADKVIPIMRTLGDVTSGMGTGAEGVKRATIALQQMNAAGRITGEDLNQLRDAGIPVYDLLAKATGKSKAEIVKLAQAGKLGKRELDLMMKALESGKGLERFSGLMEKQSKSLIGMWSTLKDTLGQGLAEAIQPAIPALKAGMEQASALFAAGFKALPGVIASIKALVAGVRSVSSAGSSLQTTLLPALAGVGAAGTRLGAVVLPIVRQISAAFLREWPKIKPVVLDAFTSIQGIVRDVLGYMQVRIGQFTAAIQYIWSRWGDQITTLTVSSFKVIFAVIGGTLKIIGGIVKVALALLTGDWRKAGEGIKQIWRGLQQVVVGITKGISTTLRTIFGGMFTSLRDRFRSGVAAIGRAWDVLRDKAKAPVRFVIETVINKGLIGSFNKIAGALGVTLLPTVSAGFHSGGWTGPGGKYQPAGIVHADEYVINKASRRRIERDSPGLLDRLNGYATGGLVGGSGRFSDLFASRLLLAQRMAGTRFNIFQRGFRPATSYSGTSHQGDAVDLGPISTAVVSALRKVGVAAWDRTGMGNWAPHIHGVPLPGAGHAAGSAVWQAQDYLRGGDGLGGRDNGPRVGVLGKIGAFLKAGFKSFADWFGNLVKDPLAKLKSITGSPFGQLAAGVPRLLVEGMRKKINVLDTGGRLEPGLTFNGTRRGELVLNRPQERLVEKAMNVAASGGGVTINGGVHGYSAADVAAEIEKRQRRQRALQPSYA